MKEIQLSQGKKTIIDDDDLERVSEHKWYLGSHHYACCKTSRKTGQKMILLHRYIMNAPDDMQVDHKNGNKLDNRKENLRLATYAQNIQNRPKNKNNKSGFKGVCKDKTCKNRYIAQITVNSIGIKIGSFGSPEDAARAYDEYAKTNYGEFANLNFP